MKRLELIIKKLMYICTIVFVMYLITLGFILNAQRQPKFKKWAVARTIDGIYWKYVIPTKCKIWLMFNDGKKR